MQLCTFSFDDYVADLVSGGWFGMMTFEESGWTVQQIHCSGESQHHAAGATCPNIDLQCRRSMCIV